jgi:2-keto-3-deoxy-L-rhamnonate aldolase RhmA
LRARLGREPLAGFWMSIGSPAIVELAASAGADVIVLDLQHGLWDRVGMEHAIGVAAPVTSVLVRVAENTAAAIGQALDAGAEGVIVPLVETAAETACAVAAACFPPHGTRSGGGLRPLSAGFPAYVEGARTRTMVGVMIETPLGVATAA